MSTFWGWKVSWGVMFDSILIKGIKFIVVLIVACKFQMLPAHAEEYRENTNKVFICSGVDGVSTESINDLLIRNNHKIRVVNGEQYAGGSDGHILLIVAGEDLDHEIRSCVNHFVEVDPEIIKKVENKVNLLGRGFYDSLKEIYKDAPYIAGNAPVQMTSSKHMIDDWIFYIVASTKSVPHRTSNVLSEISKTIIDNIEYH